MSYHSLMWNTASLPAGFDGRLCVWDIRRRPASQPHLVYQWVAHKGSEVLALAHHAERQVIMTAGNDCVIKVTPMAAPCTCLWVHLLWPCAGGAPGPNETQQGLFPWVSWAGGQMQTPCCGRFQTLSGLAWTGAAVLPESMPGPVPRACLGPDAHVLALDWDETCSTHIWSLRISEDELPQLRFAVAWQTCLLPAAP